jgi:hypothetical protein
MANFVAMLDKSTRNQMILGVFVMSMQQISGIDGVLYVSISSSPENHRAPVWVFKEVSESGWEGDARSSSSNDMSSMACRGGRERS